MVSRGDFPVALNPVLPDLLSVSPWDQLVSAAVNSNFKNFYSRTTILVLSDPRSDELGQVLGRGISNYSFSGDGQRLASAEGKIVRVWNTATGQEILAYAGHADKSVRTLAFRRDGAVVASGDERQVRIWDSTTGRDVASIPVNLSIDSLAISPDGRRLAVVSRHLGVHQPNSVHIYDVDTGRKLWNLTGHTQPVTAVTFSPDGTLLAAADWDQTTRLWDLSTGQVRHVLRGHTSYVNSLAFTRDGRRFATISFDRTAKIWDPHSGHEILTLPKAVHGQRLQFLNDGYRLAGVSSAGVQIWDATPPPADPKP